MTVRAKSVNGTGAYVEHVDLADLDESTIAKLRELLGEFGVLFFRKQSISPDQHIAFARNFGEININRF